MARTNYAEESPELGERAISRPLDNTSAVHGDRRVDEIAAERSEPGQSAIFIGPGKPAVPDHIRGQDCSEFPLLGHCHFPRCRYYHTAEPKGEFYRRGNRHMADPCRVQHRDASRPAKDFRLIEWFLLAGSCALRPESYMRVSSEVLTEVSCAGKSSDGLGAGLHQPAGTKFLLSTV